MSQGNQSEVARIRKQIQEEYEAAHLGLQGLTQGTPKHEFITKRMENLGNLTDELKKLVGNDEAGKIVTEIMDKAADQKPGEPKA